MIRDPAMMAERAAVHRAPELNLVRNSGMDGSTAVPADSSTKPSDWSPSPVPGYDYWQNEGSTGAFTWDQARGMARIQGCADGCFVQRLRVSPGEELLVEAEVEQRVEHPEFGVYVRHVILGYQLFYPVLCPQ
jgi:hypothetical protein